MFPDVYRSKADGHLVDAREATDDDVTAGLVAAIGDFLVVRRGHGVPLWYERATFLTQYEPHEEPAPAPPANDEQLPPGDPGEQPDASTREESSSIDSQRTE